MFRIGVAIAPGPVATGAEAQVSLLLGAVVPAATIDPAPEPAR